MKNLVPDQIKRPLYKFKRRYLNKGALPTFIIIGTMKGGTSSLHTYLDAHPQISMSMQKETDFFLHDNRDGRSLDWYKRQFDASKPVRGETSPNYSKRHIFPDVPQKIHEILPDTRFIYLVRDPIERMLSNFQHAVNSGRRNPSDISDFFELQNTPKSKSSEYYHGLKRAEFYYLNTSNYYYQIRAYLDYYPIDNFLILASEGLKNKRRETLKEAFRFLNVDPDFESDIFDNLEHVTPEQEGIKKHQAKKPKLSVKQLRFIKKVLKPDIDKFRELTGKSFSGWSV